jgi:ATP phosphoribosyltransferase regulatory subunit
MSYYNGIVFRGFLSGIAEGVLAGGEYGRLLSNMNMSGDAIGFAIYLDLISEVLSEVRSSDVDVLLLYKSGKEREMLKKKEELISSGKSVFSAKTIPNGIRYGECVTLGGNENA